MNKVFICSNNKQSLGAKVSKFSILSRHPELEGKVEILNTDLIPVMKKIEDKDYIREGVLTSFDKKDLQSFTLLRFMPPEIMNYSGKALVIDPDVFLVKPELNKLFEMDMSSSSILCKEGGKKGGDWASSVMILNCEMLKHWKLENFLDDLLSKNLDYRDLMSLKKEKSMISPLEKKWNDYDNINEETIFLHTTQRVTQPWKKGLKMDTYLKPVKPILGFIPRRLVHRILKRPLSDRYIGHPSKKVSDFFFNELSQALKAGFIEEKEVKKEIENKNIRKDIFSKLTLI